MGTQRVLSWLIVLIGLMLAATPWILHFAGDHIARLDVTIGGVVVALLGLALIYAMEPTAARRLSH
jgi:SPW repeat